MAFKKLIWHFYVAVAFHRLPRSGRVLLALHCSNSLRAPSPSPSPGRACTGLARERESVGGARRFLPRGAEAGAAAGWRVAAGGAGGGERPESTSRCRPGISPARPGERHENHFSSLPCHPRQAPADLSLLLKGSPLVHTSQVITSFRLLPPCPGILFVTGCLIPITASSSPPPG